MGSLLLSSKLTENSRRVREIVNTFYFISKTSLFPNSLVRYNETSVPVLDYISLEYYEWRDRVTFAEAVVLRELGFELEVYLPYGLLINYAKVLELVDDRNSMQVALGYLNDSFKTEVHILFQPNVVAGACILLSCRDGGIELPNGWVSVFDIPKEDIDCTCRILSNFYSIKTPC